MQKGYGLLLVMCHGKGNTQGWSGARESRPAMCSRGLCLRLACRAGKSGGHRLAAERTVGDVSGPGVKGPGMQMRAWVQCAGGKESSP